MPEHLHPEQLTQAMSRWRCPLPAALQPGWHESQVRENRRNQVTIIIVGWLAYLLFYFIESELYPEIAQLSLHLRLLIGLPSLPVLVWALMNVKNPLAVDAILLATVLLAASVSLYPIWQFDARPVSSGYLATSLNFVIAICLLVCIRFWWAVLACALMAGLLIATMAHLQGDWYQATLEFMGGYLPVYLFCLHLCFTRLANSRRAYVRSVLKDMQLRSLDTANQQLHQQADTDALTGIANRRAFDRAITDCLSAARDVRQRPFALLGLDIDYFKNYNDRYGHGQGDECLREVAQCLRRSMRSRNTSVYRVGGEEFAILAQDVHTLQDLQNFAQRIVESVAALGLEHDARPDALGYVTISLGACLVPCSAANLSEHTVLECADARLYEAKRSGRNCAVTGDLLSLDASASQAQQPSQLEGTCASLDSQQDREQSQRSQLAL